jgi:hypothetical protein
MIPNSLNVAMFLSRSLQAINQHCFPALFNIPAHHQKLVVDAVVWAMKHTERNISDTVRLFLKRSVVA